MALTKVETKPTMRDTNMVSKVILFPKYTNGEGMITGKDKNKNKNKKQTKVYNLIISFQHN
jgi:hypothetical protein